jgi:hypothetical protein
MKIISRGYESSVSSVFLATTLIIILIKIILLNAGLKI